jgi:hypothetical protein
MTVASTTGVPAFFAATISSKISILFHLLPFDVVANTQHTELTNRRV